MKPDPLENLMSKFDITGQTLALQRNGPSVEGSASSSAANDHEPEPEPLQPPRSASRKSLPSSKPSAHKQLKHALSVNAAHVITNDYMMLSQPLSEGIMLMDRSERRLVMVRSLGELLPLRTYNTEYGNILCRVSKHKARLANTIEVDVTSDEVDWDATLGRIALDQAGGHPEDEERMAAYKAFAAPGVPGTSMDRSSGGYSSGSASTAAEANGEAALSGERLQEKQAIAKLEALQLRMSEIETWFASVKAEAAGERQMREQANSRSLMLQERCVRFQEQLERLQTENAALRSRVADVGVAEKTGLK
uniref:Uncharacterized protein n=1 Tax=Phaeocystis antarctica TaxID=33657 RepID=A0A7S0F3J1_9EUKA|mmetsp:Transcript_34057/g.80350  ORF Transcript_34057/g.80350 Transcript_34057/m.80350 type:complete len:307 (+) Transcript_34057:41-961(+)